MIILLAKFSHQHCIAIWGAQKERSSMEKSYSEWGKHKRGIVFVECCGIMRQPKHFFF